MTRSVDILIVDDDTTAHMVMCAALVNAGFGVRLAADGPDALRQFAAQCPDLVMLDVNMPGMDGHQVCAAMRAQVGALLPIVMVTGLDDVRSVELAYESGATDFFPKPVHLPMLSYRVRYLLRGHQAMLALHAAEARSAAIIEAIPDQVYELDLDGLCFHFHAPHAQLSAAAMQECVGRNISSLLPPDAAQVCMKAIAAAHEHGSSMGRQMQLALPQGTAWFELSVARKAIDGPGRPHFIVLSRDISERKLSEQHIARLAYSDGLTGLPNRESFVHRLKLETQRAHQHNTKLGLLFMDLDGFKAVNDTLGHSAGDVVLKLAADRMRQALRSADVVASANEIGLDSGLARLGGDEFTAMLPDIHGVEDAMVVARRIGQLMRRPFAVEGRVVNLTASIGIAVFPDNGADVESLLKHADTAMYHAKSSGRDNAQLYCATLTAEAVQRMELEASLRLALQRQEFHLVYQPQVDSQTGRVEVVEALIRWQHPTRGLVSPLDFIPLAERNGLIVPIGEWVLRTACADMARWRALGHRHRVAVNLSPAQFKDADLYRTVVDTLTMADLPPQALELEITESTAMQGAGSTIDTLKALHEHGVHISLDDFGTGYSSLSYLTRLPVSTLKIDRSFVIALHDGGHGEAIIRAVVALGHSLGLRVTAEGVETLDQAQALLLMACDTLQGYHFSKPVPDNELAPLLKREWRWMVDAAAACLQASVPKAEGVVVAPVSAPVSAPASVPAPSQTLQRQQLLHRLPAPDELPPAAIHHHLRDQRPAVVVR